MPKSLQQYLDDHGGSHEQALAAMHADLAREETTSVRARQFRAAYQPLIEELDLPREPRSEPDVATARESASQVLSRYSSATATADALRERGERLGVNPGASNIAAELDALATRYADAQGSVTRLRDLEARDTVTTMTDTLQLDRTRTLNLLDGRVPQKRTATVVENGREVQREEWVVTDGKDEQGNDRLVTVQAFAQARGANLAREQTQQGTAWVSGQESGSASGGALTPYQQYLKDREQQQQASKAAAGTDPLQMQATTPTATPTQGGV